MVQVTENSEIARQLSRRIDADGKTVTETYWTIDNVMVTEEEAMVAMEAKATGQVPFDTQSGKLLMGGEDDADYDGEVVADDEEDENDREDGD